MPTESDLTPPSKQASTSPTLCLAGPTASGKTAIALALADALRQQGHGLEIISVDSALVYRGMDIGTAKPEAHELATTPHHLIDIRDPLQAYSAAEFVTDARRLIGEIRARGHVPLLVGGTMLYFKALFDGIDDMPAADPAVRRDIEARAHALGWPALHAELAEVDPATAARLAPQDSQRIQRALEVWQLSGRPLSQFHARAGSSVPLAPPDFRLISLEPQQRAWLHQRIAQRFELMLQQGLVDEVQALRRRADLQPDLPSMRCVGYRQTWDMLDGRFPAAELAERGTAATRQLAKRQITWLRSMAHRTIVDCDLPQATEQAQALLLPDLLAQAAAARQRHPSAPPA